MLSIWVIETVRIKFLFLFFLLNEKKGFRCELIDLTLRDDNE